MTQSSLPTVPQQADEVTTLWSFLDYYRVVLRRKAEGLAAEGLNAKIAASNLTLGGLLKHMVVVEKWWFEAVVLGDNATHAWFEEIFKDSDDWDFDSAAEDSPDTLFASYDAALTRSNHIIADTLAAEGLDAVSKGERRDGPVTLRWVLVHLIEEYARHAGHADLIRESIDGTTGD
jgi:uncharacterized damage-inducible protein DinB